jgi:hypothetical protein
MSNKNIPDILNEKPEPKPEVKIFHHTPLAGWTGKVDIDKVHGWAENRRIELFRRTCQEQYGRLPNDGEIYDFMLSDPELHIRELATSILYNGVRIPLILDADGTLLDGNRRYVATRYAIQHTPDYKDQLSMMPTWVLNADASAEDKRKIIVECNFIDDGKVDWPPYIRAVTVYEDYTENGLSLDQLTDRYADKKGKLRTIIKVMDLIEEFLNFKNHSEEAFRVAYTYYHWFEEAYNKIRTKLDADPDFKEQFFEWMMQGKFQNMKQIDHLSAIRDNEDAWTLIHSDNPDAVKAAIHIVEGEKLPSLMGGEKKVKRIISALRDLKESEITSMSPDTLAELKETLTELVKMAEAVIGAPDESEGS